MLVDLDFGPVPFGEAALYSCAVSNTNPNAFFNGPRIGDSCRPLRNIVLDVVFVA